MRAHFRWSNPSKYCLALSVAFFALSAPAQSQMLPVIGDPAPDAFVTIYVGDGTITGKGSTYRVAWHWIARLKIATADGGIWVQQMKRIKLDGRDVMFRSAGALLFRRNSAQYLGALAFSSVVDAKTLAPISSEQHNPDGSGEKWVFNGTHVEHHESTSHPAAKEVVHGFDLPMPAYDISATMLPNFIALQPLKSGYRSDPGRRRSRPSGARRSVQGRRPREGQGSRSWSSVGRRLSDPTTGRLRFWFSGRQPYAVKMDVPANPGIPRTVYDLVG